MSPSQEDVLPEGVCARAPVTHVLTPWVLRRGRQRNLGFSAAFETQKGGVIRRHEKTKAEKSSKHLASERVPAPAERSAVRAQRWAWRRARSPVQGAGAGP